MMQCGTVTKTKNTYVISPVAEYLHLIFTLAEAFRISLTEARGETFKGLKFCKICRPNLATFI